MWLRWPLPLAFAKLRQPRFEHGMTCRSCDSENVRTFKAEVAVCVPGLKNRRILVHSLFFSFPRGSRVKHSLVQVEAKKRKILPLLVSAATVKSASLEKGTFQE